MENIKKRFEKLSLHEQNYINGRKKYCEKWSIPLIWKKQLHFLKNCKMTEYHFSRTPYKPAGKPLAGFSLLPYVPICPAQFAPHTSTRAAKIALYNMPKMNGLFLCNFFVDIWRMICYNQSDLWITYEEGKVDHELEISNWIASSFQLSYFPSYTLSK